MPQITRTKLGAANFGPWENIVRVLILVWFMLYTLNAIPDIHPLVGRIAAKVNYWISYFFMFEYILRVLCAKPRKAYIFSGMGILDFIVCVPFLGMFFGTDWQILYSLRIVRILAIFKLARFNETAASFKKAFYLIRDEFFLFFSVILFMLYVTSLGIYIAEHDAQPEKFGSFFDALWFAVETLSTVGYGDLVPITPMGRIFTGVIMFIAVSIIAISTGLITSAFPAYGSRRMFLRTVISGTQTRWRRRPGRRKYPSRFGPLPVDFDTGSKRTAAFPKERRPLRKRDKAVS